MNERVAVAVSGGIDSLFSARILIDRGYDVTGIHFITGYGSFCLSDPSDAPETEDRIITHGPVDQATRSAMARVANQLSIPIHIVDLSEHFEKAVVNYFVDEYKKGRTPNPCLRCNPLIKFGELDAYARSIGCDMIATGHYVRVEKESQSRIRLLKGADTSKDQAYFLAFLRPEQLERALFPLGDRTKKDIIEEAEALGLTPVSQGESQDVCFISGDYKDFLAGRDNFIEKPGPIRHVYGDIIGRHKGLHSFTIGQRRGINCPGPYPYYVVALNIPENTLVVGPKDALSSSGCRVLSPSWIRRPEEFPATVTTRIRYSHKGVSSTITDNEDGSLTVSFQAPVASVTPGQGAVFYDGDEVLGGGWIA